MSTYIAEIAGKDSIAAVHKFIRENSVDTIIPTIVYTGTEYGDTSSYYRSIEYLKRFAHERSVRFMETVYLHDEMLWNYLCVKYQHQIHQTYGFYTPCIMCHLFTHLMRVPLLVHSSSVGIITGERFSHGGKLKANQHPNTINCFRSLLERNGVLLMQPLIGINNSDIVDAEIHDYPNLGRINDVKCILSGNLTGISFLDTTVLAQLQQYLDTFVFPVGEHILGCFMTGNPIQYDTLSDVIERSLQCQ